LEYTIAARALLRIGEDIVNRSKMPKGDIAHPKFYRQSSMT
jgi:hypothetical protein